MNARDAVLPEHRIDDAALLLARTHALDPQHVADCDVEDPAQVPRARKFTLDQLEAWVLEEASFVTELVVGELVTNAIRYGEPPIRLRLIRDTSLICEVSDASHTAPYAGRAPSTRAGPAARRPAHPGMGTRHTADGKTIWCAQNPHRARAAMRSAPGGPSPGSRQDGDGPRVSEVPPPRGRGITSGCGSISPRMTPGGSPTR